MSAEPKYCDHLSAGITNPCGQPAAVTGIGHVTGRRRHRCRRHNYLLDAVELDPDPVLHFTIEDSPDGVVFAHVDEFSAESEPKTSS